MKAVLPKIETFLRNGPSPVTFARLLLLVGRRAPATVTDPTCLGHQVPELPSYYDSSAIVILKLIELGIGDGKLW